MELTQLAQMVTWLDEEHRRDRAEIARLQQRLEAQSGDVIEQARRIQELEGASTKLTSPFKIPAMNWLRWWSEPTKSVWLASASWSGRGWATVRC
jgi:hypothetical protein